MNLLYLDINCFQRSFDDPSQARIQMEAIACLEIFIRAEENELKLAWSFMHLDEILVCPFPERKYEALRLSALCKIRIGPDEEIAKLAKSFQNAVNLRSKDAIHIACAAYSNVDYFLTCDQPCLKNAKKLKLNMKIMNPVDFVNKE